MNRGRAFARSLAAFAVVAGAGALAPARAAADSDAVTAEGPSIGARVMYFRPKDADHGDVSPGVQLRLPLTPAFALEGSIDYRTEKFGGTVVDVYPVQASLLFYLMPGARLNPYVLGGGGWYYTQVEAPYQHTQYRYGPHAGVGLKLSLARNWSVDASYRYLWTSDINTANAAHPGGSNFSDNGFMLTAAANYHF